MKKRAKIISLILATALVATTLIGCGKSDKAANAPKEDKTEQTSNTNEATADGGSELSGELSVFTWAWGTSDDQKILDVLESTFKEKYPNVKLTQVMIPPTEIDKKLDAALTAGNAADVLMMSPDWFGLRSKYFEDLAPYWEKTGLKQEEVFVSGQFESCYNAEGKLEALPMNANSVVMAYNEDLLAANGIEVPTADWTWDDFMSICKKVASGEGNDRIYGANNNWIIKNLAPYMYDGQAYSDDLKAVSFQEEYSVKGLQAVSDLINIDNAIPNGSLEKTIPSVQLFASGKCAFYFLPGWEAQTIGEKVGDNFKFNLVTLPKTPSGKSTGMSFITGLAVNNASKQKDLAWEYVLNASTNQKVQDVVAGLCGPAGKVSAENIYAKVSVGDSTTQQVLVDGFAGVPLNIWGGALTKIGDEFTRCWEDITLNKADAATSTQKYAVTAQQYMDDANNKK